MSTPLLCRLGLHRWRHIGFEDKVLTGHLIPFAGAYSLQVCKRCRRWKKFNIHHPQVTEYFHLEDQTPEVQELLRQGEKDAENDKPTASGSWGW